MFGDVRVLGVDPGLTRCGVGVVEGRPGVRPRLLGVGVIRTEPSEDPAVRLLRLEAGLEDWIDQHSPAVVCVERVFAHHNLRSVTGTSQAAGVAMLVAARQGLPVVMHSPSEIKAAITGYGGAQKKQVGAMVARVLGLEQAPRPADAADAVALAICHVWRGSASGTRTSAPPNRWALAEAAHRQGGRG